MSWRTAGVGRTIGIDAGKNMLRLIGLETIERWFCARSSLVVGSRRGLIGIEAGMATRCEARELQGIDHKHPGLVWVFIRVRLPKSFQSGE